MAICQPVKLIYNVYEIISVSNPDAENVNNRIGFFWVPITLIQRSENNYTRSSKRSIHNYTHTHRNKQFYNLVK